MFATTLQTDRGKKFVKEHEEDFNDQLIYRKLHRFHTTSVVALANASDMLSHINSFKFESCKGTTESFILNWQDQARLHE